MIRKYCIYKTKDTLGISTLPTDMYHRDKEGTIAGGFINIDRENKTLTLYGKSEEFGKPTIEQIKLAISNNGYMIDKDEYKWFYKDGESMVEVEKLPKFDLEQGDFLQFIDIKEFQLIQSFANIFPERNSVTVVGTKKPSRNDKCVCGSNKKYKNCCGKC